MFLNQHDKAPLAICEKKSYKDSWCHVQAIQIHKMSDGSPAPSTHENKIGMAP